MHGLVCAVADQSTDAEWGCQGTTITGADGEAIGTGAQNTADIIAGCTTLGTAADICSKLSLNGFDDWFLPSKDELDLIYQNKTIINTTAVANNGTEFASEWYWSSTEFTNNLAANAQHFEDGPQSLNTKGDPYRVRATRVF